MTELIPITERPFAGESTPTVSARELHAFLEVGKMFAHWIKERIEHYNFQENKDFVVIADSGKNPLGGRPAIEFALTLDMAKELAMVERNDKGKQARQYFLECERRLKSGVVSIDSALSNPATLRKALLTYTERVIELEAHVREIQPKAAFHDAVTEAINCQTVQEAAKVLGTGPNRLFRVLREERLLMPNNLPYQSTLDSGHFRVVERQYTDSRGESHTYTRTLITGKGLAYLQRRLFQPHITASPGAA